MKNWKVLIIILLIVIAVAVVVGFLFLNNNLNKSNLLNKYDLTETKYNELKLLADKLIKQVDEENIKNVDIYYSKSGNMLVCRGNKKEDLESLEPMAIGNDTYIVNSGGNIKILKGTDPFSEWSGTETVNSWYGGGFVNAKKDTTYKDYIYFENLEDLKNIVK